VSLLIAGIVLFLAAHLSPGLFGMRDVLVACLGEGRYRGLYVAVSVTGLALIIAGKSMAQTVDIWMPPAASIQAAGLLMMASMIMLAAFALPTNIKRFTRHPMLWAITLWSIAHLSANGDLSSILLFGSFGLYALFGMWTLNTRGARKAERRLPWYRDAIVVAAGLVLYGAVALAHPWLFGVAAIPA